MKMKMRIQGLAIAGLACVMFSGQAFAERGSGQRDRGTHVSYRTSSHNGSGYVSSGGHGRSHTSVSLRVAGYDGGGHHSRSYRRHRNSHLVGAAAFVLGGLVNSHHSSGHYEMQSVLVREGYYENYEVHVAGRYDAYSHRWIHGHHETRTRWVEPVYNSQRVWVPGY